MRSLPYTQTLTVCLTVVLLCCFHRNHAQAVSAETLLREWNNTHNRHSVEELDNLYTQVVVFDGQQINVSRIKELKRKLFSENRDYRQRIISGPRFRAIGNNVLRCDFTKEVRQKGVLWKYPAYLLIERQGNDYRIAGESDNSSDVTARNYLRNRRETSSPEQPAPLHDLTSDSAHMTVAHDSVSAVDTITNTNEAVASRSDVNSDTTQQAEAISGNVSDTEPPAVSGNEFSLATDGTVTIPLQYFYIFIGVLFTLLVVLIVNGTGSRKRKRREARLSNPDNHDHYSRDASIVFEKFVMRLFDPLYFRAFRTRHQAILANGPGEKEGYPELEFEFSQKENRSRFAIESIYISELKHRDIQIASPQQVKAYSQLDEDDHDLYLVVGIAGTPDDPKEMYLIPVKDIKSPFITYPELQRYRKYGMFFYNAEMQRLQ